MCGKCLKRSSSVAIAGLVALFAAACSSDDDGGAEVDAQVTDRLATAAEGIEAADGLHVEMRFVLYEGGESDSTGAEPDQATCMAASFEPAATTETGERAYMNFGTPHEDYANYGCLLGSTFTVDGTRVYAHTDEPAPGTSNGLLSRVGETTPELVDELTALDSDAGAELVALVESGATGVEEVDDDTVTFEIDPDELAGNAPPEAATDEPADTVTLTAAYDSEAPEQLASLEFEVTAGDTTAMVTYYYADYNQPQEVEIPVAPYITPDVTPLRSLDELQAFVGLSA